MWEKKLVGPVTIYREWETEFTPEATNYCLSPPEPMGFEIENLGQ